MSRVGDVAYRLALPLELSGVHNVCHVSILKKYISDPPHVIKHEPLEIWEDATYVEKTVRIIDTKEQELRNWTIHRLFGRTANRKRLFGNCVIRLRRNTRTCYQRLVINWRIKCR